ncbi:branched-chain amino acid ABC transporter permease [Aquipuribacter hungaricus]|uniref:Branched-chain amino acid ABC transporter permease n=1 Tax=Aquipuribacter hungaricus TaxID=545624 RepID=A0ABV7WCI0_9MICO
MRLLIALVGLFVALTVAGPAAALPSVQPLALVPAGASAEPTAGASGEPSAGASEAPAGPEAINVRVRDDETRENIEGVAVEVRSGGDVVGEGETDADGAVSFPVDGPGEYEIELDLETLPEELADYGVAQNPFVTTVEPGTPRTVAFRLAPGLGGEGGDAIVPTPSFLADIPWRLAPQYAVSGLRFGLILALAAIGLSLVFGTTGLTNFAHGELVTFGALVAWALHVLVGLPLLVAAPLTILLAGAFGWFQETYIWRSLRRKQVGLIAAMIFSIGLSFFLRYGFLYLFGGETRFYRDFSGQAGLELGPVRIPPSHLFSMGLAVVVLVAFALSLLYTRTGKATRAVSDNPALAAASGIDVDGVIRTVWVIGTALAALSGILFGLTQGMDFQLGFQVLLLIFAAVVLGGLGTAWGAMLGAVLVGLLIELSALVIPPELKNVGALAVLIIILLVRPQGLLGRGQRVG